MVEESTPFERLQALLLTACLFLAAVTGSFAVPFAVEGVSAQSGGDSVTAGNVAADPGNTATIDVTYDVSGEDVQPENLVVRAYDHATGEQVGNTDTLTDLSGTTTVDVDVSDVPGDYRIGVEVGPEGGSFIESDAATVHVNSDVGVTDIATSKTANTGETIDLNVDVENTASGTRDVRLQAYFDSSSIPAESKTYSAPSGAPSTTLQATVPDYLMPGPHEVTVNDRASATVMVSDPTVAFADLAVSSTNGVVTATATVTNEKDAEREIYVPLYVDGERFRSKPVTLGAGESKTVSVSVSPSAGDHRVGIGDLSPASVTVESTGSDGDSGGQDDTPNYDVIKGVDVTYTGVGNVPSEDPELRVEEPYDNVLMDAEVITPSGGLDLADIGADSSTEFKIVLKVHQDHEPLMLLGTAQGVTWNKQKIPDSDYYRVTVTAKPMEAQYVGNPPEQWGTDEGSYYTAEFSYEAMLDISFITGKMIDPSLDGATIATDAQSVGTPLYDSASKTLGLYVGGPHYETDGSTVNVGEYEAFLPGALLNEWGVDDPQEDLQANYNDQQYDSDTAGFQITDQSVDGGVLVEFPIHYSSGTVSVSPADSGTDDSGTDDSNSDDTSPWYPPSNSPSDTDDTEADDTETTTQAETTTAPDTTTAEPDTTSEESPRETTTTPETPTTPQTETTTASDTTTRTEMTTQTTTDVGSSTTEESTNDGGIPGFGVTVAVVSLVAAMLLSLRRNR